MLRGLWTLPVLFIAVGCTGDGDGEGDAGLTEVPRAQCDDDLSGDRPLDDNAVEATPGYDDDLAALHVQVHAVDGRERTEALDETPDLDHRCQVDLSRSGVGDGGSPGAGHRCSSERRVGAGRVRRAAPGGRRNVSTGGPGAAGGVGPTNC